MKSAIKCMHMADARDTFHAVKSMPILYLWDIQLTFDRNGVGTYGAAHIIINPSLSAAIAYNLFFNPSKFENVSTILEPAISTRTDYSMKNELYQTDVKSQGVIYRSPLQHTLH